MQKGHLKQISKNKPYASDCRRCGNPMLFRPLGSVCHYCGWLNHYTDESKDRYAMTGDFSKIKAGEDVFKHENYKSRRQK